MVDDVAQGSSWRVVGEFKAGSVSCQVFVSDASVEVWVGGSVAFERVHGGRVRVDRRRVGGDFGAGGCGAG